MDAADPIEIHMRQLGMIRELRSILQGLQVLDQFCLVLRVHQWNQMLIDSMFRSMMLIQVGDASLFRDGERDRQAVRHLPFI